MTIQYTDWVVAPFPTQIDTIPPVVSFISPPTPLEGGIIQERLTTYQWIANKPDCMYRYKGSWETSWSSWTINTISQSDNLPNGSYAFSVQAKDKFGNESAILTRSFVIFRELPVPVTLSPAEGAILANDMVDFVCQVPRGDIGQAWHFEFQIATNQEMTAFVDDVEWFSSSEDYSGFSYDSPVPESDGGTIIFTKQLELRTHYWYRTRVRLAGTETVGEPSEIRLFVAGVLGTNLILTTDQEVVRADGSSVAIIRAEVRDSLQQIDTLWNGVVNFSIVYGAGALSVPSSNVVIEDGVASVAIKSDVINQVEVRGEANNLLPSSTFVDFVSNRLPDLPVWNMASDELDFPTTMVSLVCDIPADQDNDLLHFRIEIDTKETFDSPELLTAESRFALAGWEYFDGVNWLAFPSGGVPQGNGKIRYTTTSPLKDQRQYYARIAAWDQIA